MSMFHENLCPRRRGRNLFLCLGLCLVVSCGPVGGGGGGIGNSNGGDGANENGGGIVNENTDPGNVNENANENENGGGIENENGGGIENENGSDIPEPPAEAELEVATDVVLARVGEPATLIAEYTGPSPESLEWSLVENDIFDEIALGFFDLGDGIATFTIPDLGIFPLPSFEFVITATFENGSQIQDNVTVFVQL